MAKAEIRLPNDFLDALEAASNQIDQIAGDALQRGASIVEPRVRSNLTGAITPGKGTGQLLAALGTSPVGVTRQGNLNLKVGFSEGRRDGVSHAKIATVLEYGSTRQVARPFLAPARAQSRKPTLDAMKAVFSERLKGLAP